MCVHVHTRLTQISHTGLRCTHLNILHYGMHSCTNVQTHSMSISVLTKVMHISNFSAWTGLNAEVLQAQLMDLILRCNESRQYRDKDGNMQEKDNSNTYYHPNVKCITQKHPDFVVADVRIEDTIKSTLSPPHMALLKSALNFNP